MLSRGYLFGESKNYLYLNDKSATFFASGPMFLKGVIKSLIGLSLPGDRPYLKGDPAATRLLGDIISFVSTSTYLNGDPYLRGRSYGPTGGPT